MNTSRREQKAPPNMATSISLAHRRVKDQNPGIVQGSPCPSLPALPVSALALSWYRKAGAAVTEGETMWG
ncbi:unnamed protein product [Caretta caretta]